MTVKELEAALRGGRATDETRVVMASDAEGNDYHVLRTVHVVDTADGLTVLLCPDHRSIELEG